MSSAAPAPAPAPAPAAAPKTEAAPKPKAASVTVERQEEALRKVKQKLQKRLETSEEREAERALQKASDEAEKRFRQMTPEEQEAYLAQKQAEADEQAAQKKKEKAGKKTEPEPAGPERLAAPILDWFYGRVAKAELAGIKFPENTIEGTVTAMGADQARIDFGTEVFAYKAQVLAAQGIGLGDRVRLSLLFDGEVPVNLALEKIAVEKKPEKAAEKAAQKKTEKTSKAKAKKAQAAAQEAAQEAAAEKKAPVPAGRLPDPGVYFYVDQRDGRARVLDYFGYVSLVDVAPFVAAGVKTGTLVEVLNDPERVAPFLVIKASPERKVSPFQEERLADIRRVESAKAATGAGEAKPRTSKPKAKTSRKASKPKKKPEAEEEPRPDEEEELPEEEESVPAEERAGSFAEAGASGETFFEEEAPRQSPVPKGTVYRTIATVKVPLIIMQAMATKLIDKAPADEREMLGENTVRVVGAVIQVPSYSRQRVGEGWVRIATGDVETAAPMAALRSSELIEVGDQIVLTARMDGGNVASAVIEIQRLGAPETAEERVAAARAAKTSRTATKRPASPAQVAEAAPAAEPVRQGPPMTLGERELVTKGWIALRMENLRNYLERTKKDLADLPGVELSPSEFAMEGTITALPTAIEMQYGAGRSTIDWGFEKAGLPVKYLGTTSLAVGDRVKITAALTKGVPTYTRIEVTKPEAPEPEEEVAVSTKGKTSKARSKSKTSLKKNSRASEQDPALYREFKRTINMSAGEIERWRKNPQHRDASLPHIRAELPLLAQMKRTPMSKWTPKMWNKAMRAINFVKRHEAQMKVQAKRYGTGRLHATYKRIIGLLNWGRKTPGVNIKSVLSKKTSKGRKVSRNPDTYAPADFEHLSVMSWLS